MNAPLFVFLINILTPISLCTPIGRHFGKRKMSTRGANILGVVWSCRELLSYCIFWALDSFIDLRYHPDWIHGTRFMKLQALAIFKWRQSASMFSWRYCSYLCICTAVKVKVRVVSVVNRHLFTFFNCYSTDDHVSPSCLILCFRGCNVESPQ